MGWKLAMCVKGMFDVGVRILGPVMVVMASATIAAVIVFHFRYVLPYYFPSSRKDSNNNEIPLTFFDDPTSFILYMFNIVFSLFVSFNLFFDYYMIVFTPPGYLPLNSSNQTQEEIESQPKKGEGFSRYCKLCRSTKPERSHHCHVCRRCVLKMDHHCPWVSNCVGFYNHKYFVLFLFYLWLGCAYVALLTLKPFYGISNVKTGINRGTVVFTFVITLSVTLAMAFMLGWHLYLVLTGQTTIEFYFNKYKERQAKARGEVWETPYDLGGRKNWQMFFGPGRYAISWAMPSTSPPPGDGMTYLTKSQQRTHPSYV